MVQPFGKGLIRADIACANMTRLEKASFSAMMHVADSFAQNQTRIIALLTVLALVFGIGKNANPRNVVATIIMNVQKTTVFLSL